MQILDNVKIYICIKKKVGRFSEKKKKKGLFKKSRLDYFSVRQCIYVTFNFIFFFLKKLSSSRETERGSSFFPFLNKN